MLFLEKKINADKNFVGEVWQCIVTSCYIASSIYYFKYEFSKVRKKYATLITSFEACNGISIHIMQVP